MKQISIPSINWGKRKQRSQMCEIFTEDGRIETVEFDVLLGCIDDPVTGFGFILDAENQFLDEDGNWIQVLGERSALPICMINESTVKDLPSLIGKIFHDSVEKGKQIQYTKAAGSAVWDKLVWIVTIGCGSAVLMFGIKWLGS